MTTDTSSTEIDPTARYMAQRLSALPASIREEVIEAVAGMVDFCILVSPFLEALATQLSQAAELSEEERLLKMQYYIVAYMSVQAEEAVNTARHNLTNFRKQNPRTQEGSAKCKG